MQSLTEWIKHHSQMKTRVVAASAEREQMLHVLLGLELFACALAWIIDSGASQHFTNNLSENLDEYSVKLPSRNF